MDPLPRPEIHTFVGAAAAIDRRSFAHTLDGRGILHDWMGDDLLVPQHHATEVAELIEAEGHDLSVVTAAEAEGFAPRSRWGRQEVWLWGASVYALVMGLAAFQLSREGDGTVAQDFGRVTGGWTLLFVAGGGLLLSRLWDRPGHRRAAVPLAAAAVLSVVALV